MDLNKIYLDIDGNKVTILQLVKREPEWAANRIQYLENVINELNKLIKSHI